MTDERRERIRDFNKLKLVLGIAILIFFASVHFFVKPVEIWLWTFPAFLIGISPDLFIKK